MPYIDKVADAVAENGRKVTFELKDAAQMPKGLTLTAGGYIVGTPVEAVTDREIVIIAKETFSTPVEIAYKLTIGLGYRETELVTATVGEEYDFDLAQAQGSFDITYSLADGSALPEGLSLGSDGMLTGTPTKAGVYTFTVVASEEGYVSDSITVRLYVTAK